LILFISSIAIARSQAVKSTESLGQLWFGYHNQARFTNKWGTWFDFQLRTKHDFVKEWSQNITRFGLVYFVNNATKLAAGYAYVNTYFGEYKNLPAPEHRGWQQIQWDTKYRSKTMIQRLRLEERFRHKTLKDSALANGYNFNYKLRYSLGFELPINNKKQVEPGALSFVASDEVHINFGKQVVYNYFDQNRFIVGLKFQTTTTDNLQVTYMNLFQQLSAGNKYKDIHAIRFFYFQNFDLRKKK